MTISLINRTGMPAQFHVVRGDTVVQNLPGVPDGASVAIPTQNQYHVVAHTTINKNTYSSPQIEVNGAMGYLARIMQHPARGTYVFEMIEVPTTAPDELQFQKTCLTDVTYTILKDGTPLQAINLTDAFTSKKLALGDTYSVSAVVNGITLAAVEVNSNEDVVVYAIDDSTMGEAGMYTLQIGS